MNGETEARVGVALPAGDVEISAWHAHAEDAEDLVVLAHGAGAGVQHPFFDGLVEGLHQFGVATVRFTFPYLQAGRRMPGPPAHAIAAWSAVMTHARSVGPNARVWAGGKSYGGRMASMAAADGAIDPAGLVYLGYPLHPPGKPDKPRVAHLPTVRQPQLFLSGTRDPFIEPHEQLRDAVASCPRGELEWIDGGGHSFEIAGRRRSGDEIGASLAEPIARWMARVRVQRPDA